jgi:AraC-like DNA-binding protein
MNGSACQASTAASHFKAVERVITAMRERLDEPLSLEDLASIAIISPYHFDRIFRQTVGIPPCQFLSALRIWSAKKLLLTTCLSVTDVCFEVGYNSLGTFITRFTQLVGLSPRRLRRLAKEAALMEIDQLNHRDGRETSESRPGSGITGLVSGNENIDGPTFVGFFPAPIPQGRPLACALLTRPGFYHIPFVEDGIYYAMAAAFPWSEYPKALFLMESGEMRLATSARATVVKNGRVETGADLVLRPAQLTDPPILVTLPLLLSESFGAARNPVESPSPGSPAHSIIGEMASSAGEGLRPDAQFERRPVTGVQV